MEIQMDWVHRVLHACTAANKTAFDIYSTHKHYKMGARLLSKWSQYGKASGEWVYAYEWIVFKCLLSTVYVSLRSVRTRPDA